MASLNQLCILCLKENTFTNFMIPFFLGILLVAGVNQTIFWPNFLFTLKNSFLLSSSTEKICTVSPSDIFCCNFPATLPVDNLHSSLNIYQANHSVVLEISYYLGYLMSASILHMMVIDFFYLNDGYYLWDLSSQHWFWSSDHHRPLHLKRHFQHSLDFMIC